jgi:hypothetical protein
MVTIGLLLVLYFALFICHPPFIASKMRFTIHICTHAFTYKQFK